jgi:uncharacterized protein YpmB
VIITKLLTNRRYISFVNRLIRLAYIIFFIFSTTQLHAQDEAAIRPIIEAGDLKKLEKADSYKEDADKLIEEANKLNMDVFTVQSDPNLDEKAITKKTGQLESQAQQKQIEASALYEKCNEIKFVMYKKYLDAFWNAHAGEESNYINAKLLEEQASDNYFQATSYRIDAKKMDDAFARVEKLTEANNLENDAIQKQLTSLGIYHGIGESVSEENPAQETPVQEAFEQVSPTPEPPVEVTGQQTETVTITEPSAVTIPSAVVTTDQTLPKQIEVDQDAIDRYNRYITSGQLSDTSLSTGEIAGITTFDAESLLQIWYNYIYGNGSAKTDEALAAAVDTTQPLEDAQVKEQPIPGQVIAEQTAEQQTSESMEIGVITEENKGTLIPADEEVIYRVQLAANKTQLSQRALSRMYYGDKSVEMINEEGWYKYSVGDFTTYDEANQFRKSSGMSKAFIVAYRKGVRFTAVPLSEATSSLPKVYAAGETTMPEGLVFRIQVAASRVPLTVAQLQFIYKGNYPVEVINEEGWYKYQFMGVRLYSDAVQIIRNVTTNGAFIVAYENGVKINLAEAVKKTKELEKAVKASGRTGQFNEVEYHLQLAASRIAMRSDEISMLYTGSGTISLILEDGWYKYHIKAGNSSEMAEQFRKTCGIEKAFIVAYKRAAKILYYDAIHEPK